MDTKENKKNNTTIIIVIVVLVMTLLFGGTLLILSGMGYLNFKTDSVKEEITNNNNDNNQENEDNNSKEPEENNSEINTSTPETNKPIKYNADQYIVLEDLVFNSKVTTKKVKLQNLSDDVTKEFYEQQNNVINSIHVSDSDEFNAEYKLKYFINNNILSIIYTIEATDAIGTCATKMAVTNIDLANNKIIKEKELLERKGITYKLLAEQQYEKRLDSWKKTNEYNGFETDYYDVTFADFRDNKDKYVNEAIKKIPNIIYTYIQDGEIKYDYYVIDMDTLFHPVGKGGCFYWETTTVGKY